MSSVSRLFNDELEIVNPEENAFARKTALRGRYAEFLVCADLTRLGYYATHVDAPGFDVLLVVNGTTYRVQVKSSTVIKSGKCHWWCRINLDSKRRASDSRKRALTTNDADILGLYHTVLDRIIYRHIDGDAEFVSLLASQIESTPSSESLDATLRQLRR